MSTTVEYLAVLERSVSRRVMWEQTDVSEPAIVALVARNVERYRTFTREVGPDTTWRDLIAVTDECGTDLRAVLCMRDAASGASSCAVVACCQHATNLMLKAAEHYAEAALHHYDSDAYWVARIAGEDAAHAAVVHALQHRADDMRGVLDVVFDAGSFDLLERDAERAERWAEEMLAEMDA